MLDVETAEKSFSDRDEDELYEPVEFDPECTFVDEEDGDALAFHDAMRDIWAAEGRFEILVP